MNKKISLGQFFTKKDKWLRPQIENFIIKSNAKILFDPFAGKGDLLKSLSHLTFDEKVGMDIDVKLNWTFNDSLINIPRLENSIIVTNPPYLTKYSASRKKIGNETEKYFSSSKYSDLYLIALKKMLENNDFIVAIVPETFINSNFTQKNRLHSITIIEENPFDDTDAPVCVVCFDKDQKPFTNISIYKNDKYLFTLEELENMRIFPSNSLKITFNDPEGWLALRAVDTTNAERKIIFGFKDDFDYNWNKNIKVSSRLYTLIEMDIPKPKQKEFIESCNKMLEKLREESEDTILSPFKGNMNNGVRRRRLDFKTARALLEKAYYDVIEKENFKNEHTLFSYISK